MHAAFVILFAVASQFEANANIGIRAENRTGQRPLMVGGEDAVVTEFELVPNAALDLRFKRTTFTISYSPRAYKRFDLISDQEGSSNAERPLFLHNFGLGFAHIFTRRVRLTLGGSGSVGEVDYGAVGQAQQSGQLGPDGSLIPRPVGSAPNQASIFSTQNYSAQLGLSWNVAKNHSLTFDAGGTYGASLGTNEQFPDQYGGTGGLGWAWRFDPNYSFSLAGTYGESRVDSDFAPGIGRFRSIGLSAGFSLRFSRLFSAGLGGGVLLAENRPEMPPNVVIQVDTGFSAIPTGNLDFTFIPTSGRGNYHFTTTFGVGLEGFIDPLQAQGYVPRVALAWNFNLFFYEDWSFTPSASLFTPATFNPPECMTPLGETIECQNSLSETLVSFSIPLTYQVTQEIGLAIGARISGRGTHLGADPVRFDDWFLLGFLSLTAGVATRL